MTKLKIFFQLFAFNFAFQFFEPGFKVRPQVPEAQFDIFTFCISTLNGFPKWQLVCTFENTEITKFLTASTTNCIGFRLNHVRIVFCVITRLFSRNEITGKRFRSSSLIHSFITIQYLSHASKRMKMMSQHLSQLNLLPRPAMILTILLLLSHQLQAELLGEG